jgi:hypothetical protein
VVRVSGAFIANDSAAVHLAVRCLRQSVRVEE